MASIKQRGSSYLITVSLGYSSDKQKITKSTTYTPTAQTPAKIRKEIEKFAIEFEERCKSGKYLDGETMTFNSFVKEWISRYAESNLTQAVIESYQSTIDLYFKNTIGKMKLCKINALHLQDIYSMMKDKGLSAATIRRTHAIASSVFSKAYKWNLIDDNPCKRVELPTVDNNAAESCFNVEQAKRFLEYLEQPYEVKYSPKMKNGQIAAAGYSTTMTTSEQLILYFNLAIYGGFRRGELIALTWNDINFDKNYVSINKSCSKVKGGQIQKAPKSKAGIRCVPLPPNCMTMLKNWRQHEREYAFSLGSYWKGSPVSDFDCCHLFIQEDGKQMHLDTPTHKFKEVVLRYNDTCKDVDLLLPEIHLHGLRHTFATLMISLGYDVVTISKMLGHSKVSITLDVYSHALKENEVKASNDMYKLLAYK
ncbi:site-specific integrase [Clostridium sp. AF15-31]|nr:site-specific integrase [Clostridium sp. AF15-31]